MQFDIAMTDALLATTRAVRKRLDLEKPVPKSNRRRVPGTRRTGAHRFQLPGLAVGRGGRCRQASGARRPLPQSGAAALPDKRRLNRHPDGQTARVFESAKYLMEHLHEVPVHVIPVPGGASARGHPRHGCIGQHVRVDLPRGLEVSSWRCAPAVWGRH